MAKGTLSIAGADTLTAADLAADSVGTSELADEAVTPAKMYGLGDGSGNLTGTVSSQQLHFADTFTLTGDLTVNDDLTLGKLRDDGTGQILTHTASTARVLTGTGTLRMGSSIADAEARRITTVDGMTGTLGSNVGGVGSLQKIHTITASSDATVIFTAQYITSTYKRYTLEAYDVQCASDDQPFSMYASIDNGANYLSSGNTRVNISNASDQGNDTIKSRNTSNQGAFQLGGGFNFGTGTGEVGAFTFELVNFSDTAHYKLLYYNGAYMNAGGTGGINLGAAIFGTTSAINNIKFSFGSGTILAGTFVLYGIR